VLFKLNIFDINRNLFIKKIALHGENIRLESVFGMGLYFSYTIAQNFIPAKINSLEELR